GLGLCLRRRQGGDEEGGDTEGRRCTKGKHRPHPRRKARSGSSRVCRSHSTALGPRAGPSFREHSARARLGAVRATQFLEEYAKHTALNLGQALQGLRYLTSHPDVDERAPRGTIRHAAMSAALRSRRIANDLFFAVIPPHWHHTPEELAQMTGVPV